MNRSIPSKLGALVGALVALSTLSLAPATQAQPGTLAAKSRTSGYICDSKTNKCTCSGSANCDKLAASGVCWGGTLKPGTGGQKTCDWQHSKRPGGGMAGPAQLAAKMASPYKCNGFTMTCNCEGKADCDQLKASSDCLDDVDMKGTSGSCNWKQH